MAVVLVLGVLGCGMANEAMVTTMLMTKEGDSIMCLAVALVGGVSVRTIFSGVIMAIPADFVGRRLIRTLQFAPTAQRTSSL